MVAHTGHKNIGFVCSDQDAIVKDAIHNCSTVIGKVIKISSENRKRPRKVFVSNLKSQNCDELEREK
jgi:hypothetical protein